MKQVWSKKQRKTGLFFLFDMICRIHEYLVTFVALYGNPLSVFKTSKTELCSNAGNSAIFFFLLFFLLSFSVVVIILISYWYKMLWTPRLQGTSILLSKHGKIATVIITKTVQMSCHESVNQSWLWYEHFEEKSASFKTYSQTVILSVIRPRSEIATDVKQEII